MGFEINNGTLVKYTEEPGVTDVVIPDGVKEIESGAFRYCSSLISIKIPDGVRHLDEETFDGCTELRRIVFPPEIEITPVIDRGIIYYDTFHSLVDIDLPVTSWKKLSPALRFHMITDAAVDAYLEGSDQQSENMKNIMASVIGLKKIRESTLDRLMQKKDGKHLASLLSKLKKPLSIEEIDRFIEICKPEDAEIKAIWIDYKNRTYSCEAVEEHAQDQLEKELGFKERTPADWRKIFIFSSTPDIFSSLYGDGICISGYRSTEPDVVIPEKIGNKNVTKIADKAFYRNGNIRSVIIPDGMYYIGNRAFEDCKKLTELNLPQSLHMIGYEAFSGCAITKIDFPQSLHTIREYTFTCGGMTELVNMPSRLRGVNRARLRSLSA